MEGLTRQANVFKVTSSGTLTSLYCFCSQPNCADGEYPAAELAQDTDGNFYGTTVYSSIGNDGTIFKITPSGSLTTLQNIMIGSYSGTGVQPGACSGRRWQLLWNNDRKRLDCGYSL